jgi:N-acetylmuramoyl-L-alanine amidase
MVMIREDFLPEGLNWSNTPLVAQGVVVHSTATPSATAADEDKYFHGANRDASAHIFVDWVEAVKIVPLSKVAWHAGYTANHKFYGVELSETSDPAQWAASLENLLDLLASIFQMMRWPVDYTEPPVGGRHLYSHAQTSQLYRETDHTDPVAYLDSHGYSMLQLADDLSKRVAAS